jgi:6-phosphogluconolactonase
VGDDRHGPAIVVLEDPTEVVREGALRVQRAAEAAIAISGGFRWALAGGSTPRPLYARLAAEPLRSQVEWARIQLFFSDERCVPPEHPDSNFGMVKETLLDWIDIPVANVHRMRGEEDPLSAAAAYEQELLRPMDLALLGIGRDGHTASLFPHTPVLAETSRACAVVELPLLHTTRLTLTIPVFLETREILFLVTGAEKADVLRDVVNGPYRPLEVPSQTIARRPEPVTILCDRAAAAHLSPGP